jgi:hypothetical protein
VYVNDMLVKVVSTYNTAAFSAVLGLLAVGDVVYVAGTGVEGGVCPPTFGWDFLLQWFPASNPAASMAAAAVVGANSIVATTARTCESTDAGALATFQGALQVSCNDFNCYIASFIASFYSLIFLLVPERLTRAGVQQQWMGAVRQRAKHQHLHRLDAYPAAAVRRSFPLLASPLFS